jgi:hypothetical protein
LVATTPKEYLKDAHHWLILHGRYVCVARLPACPKCIIADLCEFPDKTPAKKLDKSDAPVVRKVGPRAQNAKASRGRRQSAGSAAGPAGGGRKSVGSAGRKRKRSTVGRLI